MKRWTKEKCQKEALKYKTRNDFRKKSSGAYQYCIKNKIIDDICKHMKVVIRWTKEKCQEESLKYKTRTEFRKSSSAYKYAIRNNIINDVCLHMKKTREGNNYWTKEKCQKEALKYNYRTELKKLKPYVYHRCRKNNWLDDVCKHMNKIGNRYERCIYACEFEDNTVYIGLTYNIDKRFYEHNIDINSAVYKYRKYSKLVPKIIKLTNYINVDEAKIKEGEYVEQYRNNGWSILNKIKTGGIGSKLYWTYDKCEEILLLCKIKQDFYTNYSSAYTSALKNGWLKKLYNTKNW